jgi:hypothetical protein
MRNSQMKRLPWAEETAVPHDSVGLKLPYSLGATDRTAMRQELDGVSFRSSGPSIPEHEAGLPRGVPDVLERPTSSDGARRVRPQSSGLHPYQRPITKGTEE